MAAAESKPGEGEWAAVGVVVAPFGIRGELKVRLLTDIPDRFAQLKEVYFDTDYQPHRIVQARQFKGEMILLRMQGVEDMNAAELLRNVSLLIPLSELAELPAGSYYRHDIIGLQVLTLKDRILGKIVDIIETGSNDVYVVRHDGKEHLIPAIKDVVKQVDLKRGMVYIDPIKGLLDDEEEEFQSREEED